jgi:hypothetical protein
VQTALADVTTQQITEEIASRLETPTRLEREKAEAAELRDQILALPAE